MSVTPERDPERKPGRIYPQYNRRTVEIVVRIDTNMSPSELGGLAEGTEISISEFGREHLEMPRYEQVICRTLDAYYRPV